MGQKLIIFSVILTTFERQDLSRWAGTGFETVEAWVCDLTVEQCWNMLHVDWYMLVGGGFWYLMTAVCFSCLYLLLGFGLLNYKIVHLFKLFVSGACLVTCYLIFWFWYFMSFHKSKSERPRRQLFLSDIAVTSTYCWICSSFVLTISVSLSWLPAQVTVSPFCDFKYQTDLYKWRMVVENAPNFIIKPIFCKITSENWLGFGWCNFFDFVLLMQLI